MLKFIAKLLLLVLVTMSWATAAQEWLPDRSSREGPGIKLGDSLMFHPGLGVEGGYDTNPMRNDDFPGAGRLRVTPYLDLASRSQARRIQDEGVVDITPSRFDLRFGLAGYYDWYFSSDNAVDDQDHFGVDTHLNFTLFPQGVFSLILDAVYLRSLQPYESNEGEPKAWNMIRPGIGFRLRPGGGTLSFELGYRLRLMLFEDSELKKRNNKMNHDVRFITSWKILPKTSFISKVYFSPIVYTGSAEENIDSMPVRALFGVQGLLTPRFGLSLFLGYGAGFYKQGDDFGSVLASGELMFFITPTANIRFGGKRDFVDSYYSNFLVKNGGYLKYEQMFGSVFLASLKGDIYHHGYSTMVDEEPGVDLDFPDDRSEIRAGATLLLEFRATDWLSIHASGRYESIISDFEYTDVATTDKVPIEFNKFEVLAGVRAHY
ncbi:MAG: hypothetical protein GY847_41260 [Proteobacteria bacterium]|nr:hypothetical protein [Pseudomonadota bacterium]